MKIKLLASILCVSIAVTSFAQTNIYERFTTFNSTNYYPANSTYTYTGTNIFNTTRHSEVGLTFTGEGEGDSTNTVTKRYLQSNDATNWWVAPFAFVITMQGTNRVSNGTNISVGAFGYLKEYTTTTATTNAITNATSFEVLKSFRRDVYSR